MKIEAIRIVNYKGFLDSGFVELGRSWNVVVGENNAGKTAFIEGFRLGMNENKLHKDASFPRDFAYPAESRFLVKMLIDRNWLKTAWLKRSIHFDLPMSGTTEIGTHAAINPDTFWKGGDLLVELEFTYNNSIKSDWPSHGLFKAAGNQQYARFHATIDRKMSAEYGRGGGMSDTLPSTVVNSYANHIYIHLTPSASRWASAHMRMQRY